MVDVRLNGRASARLMLDTGADRTLINPRSLIAAGVPLQRAVGRSEVRGVTGKDTVLWVVVDSLEVGQARVTKIPVAAYEMGAYESDGLLGRDFLDRFNLSIDASRGLVTLTPR
jgi:predicted aspartyl protease